MNDKLNQAFDHIGDVYIMESIRYRRRRRTIWISILAFVLVMTLLWCTAASPIVTAKAISKADYDALESYQTKERQALLSPLTQFWTGAMAQVLSGNHSENLAFSPVNLYMALAVTAELAGGDDQILSLLGADSLEALRTQANCLWNATYRDSKNPCLLANSLWLDSDLDYNQSTMDTLAENYYTSVYRCNFGSPFANRAISSWLKNQTGSMLKNISKNIDLDPDTIFALYSTIYFQAKWSDAFSAANNTQNIFHGVNGDVTCTYMNRQRMQGYYYWGDAFSAVTLSMKDGSKMWLILPDAGRTMEDVLSDPDFGPTLFRQDYGRELENSKYMFINLSLPKFDIRSSGDLKEDLQALGITDVFDPNSADFSAIYRGNTPVWLSAVNQATRVCIDEKGVTAASYIEIPGAGSAAPPEDIIDFILDRPFLFVVTNSSGLPLFAGVVNEP